MIKENSTQQCRCLFECIDTYFAQYHGNKELDFKQILKTAYPTFFNDKYTTSTTEDVICKTYYDNDMRFVLIFAKRIHFSNAINYLYKESKPLILKGIKSAGINSDHNYHMLSKIIKCCAKGKPVILIDLESIYSILYDLFNQSYQMERNSCPHCFITLREKEFNRSVKKSFRCAILIYTESNMAFDCAFLSRFCKFDFPKSAKEVENEIISKLKSISWTDWFTK